MAIPRDQFVREFLAAYFEKSFVDGSLPFEGYSERLAALNALDLVPFAEKLFSRSPSEEEMPGQGVIRLVHLREIDGSEFPFLLAIPKRPTRRKRLTCFVGHRFLKEIEGPLRFNLAHILEPYRIELTWASQDVAVSDIFGEVVNGIRTASMCFFDNLSTDNKPNVYIETGIAYALGVPTILAEYSGPKEAWSAAIPSDLQGLFRIRYGTYEELFRTLYFGLPHFVARMKRVRTVSS